MDLTKYMNDAIGRMIRDAIFSSQLNAKELLFLNKTVKAQKEAAQKRLLSDSQGAPVPPFLIASIATKCNLHCAGCYARANKACLDESAKGELSAGRWSELFSEANSWGVSFILLAGGEPLERPDVLEAAEKTPELIFPVFTNGTLFTPKMLERFDTYRNLIPVISVEGDREQTDRRRGKGIFDTIRHTMESMGRIGIFYGVSVTVTKDNLDTVTDEAFVSALGEIGCKLVFYVEYVPADGNSKPALEEQDRQLLEKRQSELRSRFPNIILLSFPGDEKEMGGCLAAGRGFFHINAFGDAEPCPFSPFSDTSLRNVGLREALDSALFDQIRKSNFEEQEHIGGCVLFARKTEVENLLKEKLT